jgi:hypothetical protein
MIELSDLQKSEYFKRSSVGVDGLWFRKVEDQYDFTAALGIDAEVWKIVPKIQARFLKEALQFTKGIQALKECFSAKAQETICSVEGDCRAAEFGPRIRFELGDQLCAGGKCCTMRFSEIMNDEV